MGRIDIGTYTSAVRNASTITHQGVVVDVIGLLIESLGPKTRMGDICRLIPASGVPLLGEVVGFRGGRVLLMPYGEIDGISPGTLVESTGKQLRVAVGDEMLGRLLMLWDFPWTKPTGRSRHIRRLWTGRPRL